MLRSNSRPSMPIQRLLEILITNLNAMKIKILKIYAIVFSLTLTACEYDNFETPKSVLSGQITHGGAAVQIRNNGPELELWQDGFALRSKISVYADQNGHFSAELFDGRYKLTRLSNAPWLQQPTDTILVEVKGNTTINVPVTPYFSVPNVSASFSGNAVTCGFEVSKVLESAQVDDVRLFISTTTIVDNVNNEQNEGFNLANLAFGQSMSMTASLNDLLLRKAAKLNIDQLFVRIGVRSKSAGEYNFSSVEKIKIK